MLITLGAIPFVLLLLGFPVFIVLLTGLTATLVFVTNVPLAAIHQGRRYRIIRARCWALGAPVIILGGIYGGLFSPTRNFRGRGLRLCGDRYAFCVSASSVGVTSSMPRGQRFYSPRRF